MPTIAFLGAGSTVFARNLLGDCMATPALADCYIHLHDIDPVRLKESHDILSAINTSMGGRARISSTTNRRQALQGADYVFNAIQVGGYDPCTVTDFEIPKKYGLRQTIADTLGIGGIFRGLRTIHVMEQFARDIEELCPNAWLLNYTNPMAILTGYMLRHTGVKTVGLCHSVQACVPWLLKGLNMPYDQRVHWHIAGINHMAWLLSVTKDGEDLYPEIKARSKELGPPDYDRVRHEMMHTFGYYVTESSEHNAEYLPYFINSRHPELIERYNIPLDEYPRRCEKQISGWAKLRDSLLGNASLVHTRTEEYASYILEAMETNMPYKIGGNVLNNGLITNLPNIACVEVPCMVDAQGVSPVYVGDLPEQCAALCRTNINVQFLTIQAAVTHKREHIYHAALLDPHTASELTIDQIHSLCDDLIDAHGDWLPQYH